MSSSYPASKALSNVSFHSYGTGGGKEKIYGLCVLPLNIINQKFYTIFWIWLSVLLVLSMFAFTMRIILVISAEARDFMLRFVYGIKEFNVSS
jgi:hypothetical protein